MKLINMTPNLMVNDVNETVNFYKEHLGFQLAMSVPDEGSFNWALVKNEDISIMFQTQASIAEDLPVISSRTVLGGAIFYFNVENIENWYERLKKVTTVLSKPSETFYGTMEFSFLDCNGYIITFAEDKEDE